MAALLTMVSLEEQPLVNSFNKVFLGAAGTDTDTGPSDDQFNRVNFLSHFEGANNGVNNAFDDGSTNNYTVIAAGDVTQGSFGPFARPEGEWGWDFDGNGDSLTFTNDATMLLDGDYTFELFFNARAIVQDTQHPNTFLSGTTQLYIHSSSRYISWYANSGNIVHSANNSILTNVWNHVAIVRSGTGSNNTSMYLNGTRVQQYQNTATLGADSGTARIGSYSAAGGNFDGHISNLRILKGTALYSGSSITVPTAPLTAVSNTKLLTCQSNRFVDNSSTGFAITPVGNTAVTAFGPILTSAVYNPAVNGASAYLDGSGDTLRVVWTAADIVNQNFTLEYWLYYTQTSGYGSVSISGSSGGGNTSGDDGLAHLSFLSTNGQVFTDDGQNSGSGPDTGAGGISANSWHHLALVRVSDDMFIYINGVKAATKSLNTALFDEQSVELGVGVLNKILGYVTDVRLVTSAVYTGNTYTVPTAPLTAITNTKVLLNMKDGQAIDSAAQNNLTFNGTSTARPKISTTVKKFGDSSFYVPDTAFAISTDGPSFGLGDFTVEMWIYWAGNPGASSTIYSQITSNTDAGTEGPHLYWDSSSRKVIYFANNGGRITSTNAVSNTTWYHLALSRASGSTKMFLDGAQTGSTYSDTINFTGAANIQIGTYRLNGTNVARNNQYYDDLRVSNFARYTSNFTAPSAAFPDKGQ